jgi:hypothetical protein
MGFTPRGVVAVMYAVAAVFGALSLLTMNARGQVVGMVVIASSVVTWIGVQQLGYAEFAEIQRTLREGFGNERRSIGNNVYLASLTQHFAEAADLDQLGRTLGESMARLEFQGVEVLFAEEVSPAVRAAFPAWSAEAVDLLQPLSTWRIPLDAVDGVVATVVLTRSLHKPTPFAPTYLLHALRNGFAPRLRALAKSGGTVLQPGDRATASRGAAAARG